MSTAHIKTWVAIFLCSELGLLDHPPKKDMGCGLRVAWATPVDLIRQTVSKHQSAVSARL